MRPTSTARSLNAARRQQRVPLPSRSLLASRSYADVAPALSSSSSSSSSSTPLPAWPRPVPKGKLPAYDAALDFIRARDDRLAARRQAIAEGTLVEEEGRRSLSNLKGADKLDVRIHDPEVRWKWEHGLADPNDASSKYLSSKSTSSEEDSTFTLRVSRQMHVVPDVTMLQSGLIVDFGFRFPAPPPKPAPEPDQWGWVKKIRPYQTRDDTDEGRVLCGAKLTVKESLVQPELHIRHFGDQHKGGGDHKRYTILLLDADVPDPKNYSFTQKILWMVPNIELSPSTRVFPSPDFPVSKTAKHIAQLPPALIPYLPPHPLHGADNHRFTFLLLRHNGPINFGKVDSEGVVAIPDRNNFNFRQWSGALYHRKDIKSETRNPNTGRRRSLMMTVAGCSFFRSSYDEEICPKIWQHLIRKPEVKYKTRKGDYSNRTYLTPTGQNKIQRYNLRNKLAGPGAYKAGEVPKPNKYLPAFGLRAGVSAEEKDAPADMVAADLEGDAGEAAQDLRETASSVKATVEDTVKEVKPEAKSVVESIKAKAADVQEAVVEKAEEVKETVQEKVDEVKDSLGQSK